MQKKTKLPKILDCTLRDGGYYTQWDFDKNLVKTYFNTFNSLPVDYLEIGYRSNPMDKYLGEFFYCPPHVLKYCKENSNKKLVIILNEKDVRPEHVEVLLGPCKGYIDMVRMAIAPDNFERALKLAGAVKKLGFEIGFNVMYMSDWKEYPDFLNQIKEVTGLVDYFYMVDSFGGVYPKDVRETFQLIRDQTDVSIGFHGHNNLELGLINTLTAIDCGAEMVDATITGMGRGAGNLSTELLLTALNGQGMIDLDFNVLSKVVQPFSEMQTEFNWGTSLPYMVSGANSLPQKEVMEWVTKRYYSLNSIIRALSNQSKGIKDNVELEDFEIKNKFENALIIGGGASATSQSEAINEFLKKNTNTCVIHSSSKNAMSFLSVNSLQIHCLAGNEGHRLEETFQDISSGNRMALLPTYPRTMGTYIPEKLENVAYQIGSIEFTDKYLESVTALSIEVALSLGIKNLYFAGYDGYQGEISKQQLELFNENEYLFKKIKENSDLKPISITPTQYTELIPRSVFALI